MPVDLSAIPKPARRKSPPSVKRWLVYLLGFLVCGGIVTLWLWPETLPVKSALFWHCFIIIPFVLWGITAVMRWLLWLNFEWFADGWDNERELDLKNEIERAQRFIVLNAMSVHLPHVAASEAISQQFLVPDGVSLPAVVDEKTLSMSHYAEFNDAGEPLFSARINKWLGILLADPTIQSGLYICNPECRLKVVIQIANESQINEVEVAAVKQTVIPLVPSSAIIEIISDYGLSDIDNWLDEPDTFHKLLVLSINLFDSISDGEGEVAVGLLFCSADSNYGEPYIARVHRPECTKEPLSVHSAARQAMRWGKVSADDVASLWLSGVNSEHNLPALLAVHNLKFPRAEENKQLIHIDIKSGTTGLSSPWLALALAAGNSESISFPQLVINMAGPDITPWWFVVHPYMSP